jgi:hypothetical protein
MTFFGDMIVRSNQTVFGKMAILSKGVRFYFFGTLCIDSDQSIIFHFFRSFCKGSPCLTKKRKIQNGPKQNCLFELHNEIKFSTHQ